jgi:DNA-binding response OmpR family regulator
MRDAPTIVFVDDDADFRSLCRDTLEAQGYRVFEVDDGDLLLPHLEEHGAPHLVVMDVMMPGRTGWAVLGDLRRDERFAKVPVVFVTSRDDDDFRMLAKAKGAQGYHLKPLGPRELVNVVRDAIQHGGQTWGSVAPHRY